MQRCCESGHEQALGCSQAWEGWLLQKEVRWLTLAALVHWQGRGTGLVWLVPTVSVAETPGILGAGLPARVAPDISVFLGVPAVPGIPGILGALGESDVLDILDIPAALDLGVLGARILAVLGEFGVRDDDFAVPGVLVVPGVPVAPVVPVVPVVSVVPVELVVPAVPAVPVVPAVSAVPDDLGAPGAPGVLGVLGVLGPVCDVSCVPASALDFDSWRLSEDVSGVHFPGYPLHCSCPVYPHQAYLPPLHCLCETLLVLERSPLHEGGNPKNSCGAGPCFVTRLFLGFPGRVAVDALMSGACYLDHSVRECVVPVVVVAAAVVRVVDAVVGHWF